MLIHPHIAPVAGELKEIAPGILWTRLSLPFRLDHVNIYFLRDKGGWLIVDTGISNRETRNAWRMLLEGPMKGETITRLMATHHHPDHIGLAGWLCETLDIPFLTSRTSMLSAISFFNSPDLLAASEYTRFYASHGMSDEVAALISTHGHDYMRMLSKPPSSYDRLADGDIFTVGSRDFHVLSGDGHSPEQLMLLDGGDRIFLAADQVIEKITPNISISALEPNGNPLGDYLASLRRIIAMVPEDSLVLSGHRLPFFGLHERCRELLEHHSDRCAMIVDALAQGERSAAELVPVLFRRQMSPHEMSFAFSETLAHMNHLIALGEIVWSTDAAGRRRVMRD